MTPEEAIRRELLLAAGVAALVDGRVHVAALPQKSPYPAVVIHLVSAPRDHHMEGASGFVEARYQVNCHGGPAVARALELSRTVRLALDGFSGTMGGAAGVSVHGAFLEDTRVGRDDDLIDHWVEMDFLIQFTDR
ncbi:MAG: DUF3168 domain-containing protein [Phycisphaerales bacterium]